LITINRRWCAVPPRSGYAEEPVHGEDLEREQLKVLRKPYHQADLAAALREALAVGAA
jgi:hypothetical protein